MRAPTIVLVTIAAYAGGAFAARTQAVELSEALELSEEEVSAARAEAEANATDDTKGWGAFDGMKVVASFPTAAMWGRKGKVVPIVHRECEKSSCPIVIAAQYSEETAVSQLVFYRIDAKRFCSGCGRGTGWHNDEKLKLAYAGDKPQAYATSADYGGVGHWHIDRGHQAPVASFNEAETIADITNLPTNLSPQSAALNQNNWRFLEADIRNIAQDGKAVEAITGPVYELPDAMLQAPGAKEKWKELITSGGNRVSSKGDKKRDPVPWCAKDKGGGTFTDDLGKTEGIKCVANKGGKNARDNPNQLIMTFSAGKKTSTPLRIPLGYYKMFTVKGKGTCAFIMDQVGQCLLTSVQLLEKIAHLDLKKFKGDKVKEDFCLASKTVLSRKNMCVTDTASINDPKKITTAMIKKYWDNRAD